MALLCLEIISLESATAPDWITYTHMHISGTPPPPRNLRMEGYDIGVQFSLDHSLLFSVPSLVIGLCVNWYLLKIEVSVRVKHILVYGIMICHLRIVLILCPFSKIIVMCSFLGSITCLDPDYLLYYGIRYEFHLME